MPYSSKRQQAYFHAKAEEGDPTFKKLAPEYDQATKDAGGFKNLPEKSAPAKKHSRHPGSSKKRQGS